MTKLESLHGSTRLRIVRFAHSLPFVIAIKAVSKLDILVEVCRYFDEMGIKYMVAGGLALEGMRGKMTRIHRDVDIAFLDDQVSAVVSALLANGFRIETVSAFIKRAYKREIRVDLYEWQQRADGMVEFMSNVTMVRIPRAFLEDVRWGHIGEVAFKIPSSKYLISILPFIAGEEDRSFVMSLNRHEGIEFRQFTGEIQVSTYVNIFEHLSKE